MDSIIESRQRSLDSLLPTPELFRDLHFSFQEEELELQLDLSCTGLPPDRLSELETPLQSALAAMTEIENGGLANSDESRMVGHYWLRDPARAPSPELHDRIVRALDRVEQFAEDVLAGRRTAPSGTPFEAVLAIGIGGSALGPQLVVSALSNPREGLPLFFLDNTDPDGIERTLEELGPEALGHTLVIVTSKSGGTPETLNGMLEAERAYRNAGLSFSQHAVAVTGDGSKLYRRAVHESWLDIFPMEDWVGGRTSVTSAVGLLPAALAGIPIRRFLRGAQLMDQTTRRPEVRENPAALLAAAWYHLGKGRGAKNMVVLPYKDSLELFSRYLQQLIMESLGKALDRNGARVEQGLTVYGNKGSTDQHAYVQQLRDGLRDFFATFLTVERARRGSSFELAPGVETGDYLNAFFLGTRSALAEEGRPSLTISLPEVTPLTLGALIAWFERTVGLYAELIDINAYHQPGVEAGKEAASGSLELQGRILAHLEGSSEAQSAAEIASTLGEAERTDVVYYLCRHLAANSRLSASGFGLETRFRAWARA